VSLQFSVLAQFYSLLKPLITYGVLLHAWSVINGSVHTRH